MREAKTLPVSAVTLATIRQYLRQERRPPGQGLLDTALQRRLDIASLSAATLLAALQIVHDANHPFLTRLGVSHHERGALIYRLSGIADNRSGFRTPIRSAARNANDDPEQLIANVLEYVRNLNPYLRRSQS